MGVYKLYAHILTSECRAQCKGLPYILVGRIATSTRRKGRGCGLPTLLANVLYADVVNVLEGRDRNLNYFLNGTSRRNKSKERFCSFRLFQLKHDFKVNQFS